MGWKTSPTNADDAGVPNLAQQYLRIFVLPLLLRVFGGGSFPIDNNGDRGGAYLHGVR